MGNSENALPSVKKRNYAIDLIKMLFAVPVALYHYGVHMINGDVVVMSFFIFSGYFLLESFDSGKYASVGTWGYTKNKIKKIYLDYLLSFCCLFALIHLREFPGCLINLFDDLPELFLVQNIGVYDGGINYPLWQICSLFVASHLLFALLSYNRNLTVHFIAPVLAMASFTYMADIFDSHTVEEFGVAYSMIYVPTLRALGGLAAGISLHMIIKDAIAMAQKWNAVVVNLLGILAFAAYFYKSQTLVCLVALPFVMVYCFLPQCLLNKALVAFAGWITHWFKYTISLEKWSLSIYFNHAVMIKVFYRAAEILGKDTLSPLGIFAFIVCILIFSYIMVLLANWIRRLYGKRKNPAAA